MLNSKRANVDDDDDVTKISKSQKLENVDSALPELLAFCRRRARVVLTPHQYKNCSQALKSFKDKLQNPRQTRVAMWVSAVPTGARIVTMKSFRLTKTGLF